MSAAVDVMHARLAAFEGKCGRAVHDELDAGTVMHTRVQHLQVCARACRHPTCTQASQAHDWNRVRVDRLIVDYLLRAGYYDTAALLAKTRGLESIINAEVFTQAQHVINSLAQHKIDACLEWCHDNKSKLRRLNSRLELCMREQEFIELVREGDRAGAVAYARRHFSVAASTGDGGSAGEWTNGKLSHVMGLLAVYDVHRPPAHTAHLLCSSRWTMLTNLFWDEFYRYVCLTLWHAL
jgi:macrophage erythroblast attacher